MAGDGSVTGNAAFIRPVEMDDDLRARQDTILGEPPRIQPLPRSEWSEGVIAMNRGLREAFRTPPDQPPPDYVATVYRHPSLFEKHNQLAIQLVADGALTPRDRELAVLRLAWLLKAPYEWGEHVGISKRLAGFIDEEIEWVMVGSSAPCWNDRDRAIIRAVEELLDTAMISDETWNTLAKHLDERQLLELPILIGQYQGVAYLQNSIRATLNEGNPGLAAR
jgi:alkylhydroperoxidase family enzyme